MFKSVPDVGRAGLQHQAHGSGAFAPEGQPRSSPRIADPGFGKLTLFGSKGRTTRPRTQKGTKARRMHILAFPQGEQKP